MEMEMIKRFQKMACKAMEEITENDLKHPEGAAMAKNLASFYLKLDEMGEGEQSMRGYSGRGGTWDARGSYGENPYGGESYNDYPMAGGNSYRGGRRMSYSNGKDEIIEQLEQMANEAGSSQERNAIQQAVRQLRTAK